MPVRLCLLSRLLLTAVVGAAVSAATLPVPVAHAQDDDDWDDDDDEDDEYEDDEDEEEEGYVQPPASSGGMYTKRTYPTAELDRTLTVLGGMLEVRAGLDIDASNERAFENWAGVIDARYGIKDFFELRFGTSFFLLGDASPGPGGTNQARFDIGFENSMYFDVVDFRMGLEMPVNPDCKDNPTCDTFAVDLAFGFPFRYKPHPQFAIIALDKLMTIHFADQKPDLTLGVGVVGQIVPQLAVIARGELLVAAFNFDRDEGTSLAATAALQFSPNNRFDLGLEFTLRNLIKPDVDDMGEKTTAPFDDRFLLLFVQARF